jgi:hypothetical protein
MLIKGWDDAVVGVALRRGRRFAIYSVDRAVIMWERRGLSYEHAAHMVAIARHTPGRRIWLVASTAREIRLAALRRKEKRAQRRKRDE